MIKKYFTREVKIGMLAVSATALLLFGLNFLNGINVFKPTNFYYVTFSNIDGLVETAPVYIKGHQVGQVREIYYDFTKEVSFVITLDVNKDLQIPKGTKVELFDNGLLGGKAIRLVYGPQVQNTVQVGDTLQSVVVPSLMKSLSDKLLPKIDALVSSTDSLITSVRKVTGSTQLQNSMEAIERSSKNLEQTSEELKVVMKQDMPKIFKSVSNITSDFSIVSNNLKSVDFAKTVGGIDATMADLQGVTKKMNSKEGTLGLLINDRALYDNLSSTSSNANLLMVDFKENPKRYVHFSVFAPKAVKK